jgi:hypothetical protein
MPGEVRAHRPLAHPPPLAASCRLSRPFRALSPLPSPLGMLSVASLRCLLPSASLCPRLHRIGYNNGVVGVPIRPCPCLALVREISSRGARSEISPTRGGSSLDNSARIVSRAFRSAIDYYPRRDTSFSRLSDIVVELIHFLDPMKPWVSGSCRATSF